MPLVSIIVPYYKKKNFIELTIIKILRQTFQNFEVLIVYDDNDKTDLTFIKNISYQDKRIKLIVNKNNLGAGLSRNKAIKESHGKYIAFCDSDDVWKSNKLDIQIKYMQKNKLDFSYTNYNIINVRGQNIGNVKVKKKINFEILKKDCCIGLSTVVIKKDLLKKNRLFSNLKTKEDFALWLKFLKDDVKFIGINKNLVSWRKTTSFFSYYTIQKLLDGYRVYRNHMNNSILESLINLFYLSFNFILRSTKFRFY